MNKRDAEDFEFLTENGRIGREKNLSHFIHLDNRLGVQNYIRIANDIVRQMPEGHLLDWGCGYGQMTYLLRQRGLTATAFDVGSITAQLPDIPLCRAVQVIHSEDKTALPFEPASFEAVLSCGVLEHINEGGGDEIKSLHEIYRVLRPQGRLFIYQLPQQFAWQEALIRRYNLGYAHPRRYTLREITQILNRNGFGLTRAKRFNLLPKNLTGMPQRLKLVYSQFSQPLLTLDKILSAVPGLNQLAGVLEITAQKVDDTR
jgi:SAM-dependent methyltransferase